MISPLRALNYATFSIIAMAEYLTHFAHSYTTWPAPFPEPRIDVYGTQLTVPDAMTDCILTTSMSAVRQLIKQTFHDWQTCADTDRDDALTTLKRYANWYVHLAKSATKRKMDVDDKLLWMARSITMLGLSSHIDEGKLVCMYNHYPW